MKKILSTIAFIFGFAILAELSGISFAAAFPPGLGGTGTSAAPSSGMLLIGNGAATYTPALLTPGTDIVITNASGSVTIAVNAANFLPSSTIYVASVNGQSGAVTITSSTLGVATNTLSLFNGNGFTTTTIQSVLNALSATGLLTYNSSTGAFGYTSSSLALGTASHYNFPDFLPSSTVYVTTVNGQSGAVSLGIPATSTISASGTILTGPGFTFASSTTIIPFASGTAVYWKLATTSISQFVNDKGYLTSAPATTSINQALGPLFNFVASSTGNALSFASSTSGGSSTITFLLQLSNYLTTALQSLNGATSSAQTIAGGTGISVSTTASPTNGTTTITNTGVTSLSSSGCVSINQATGTVALSTNCNAVSTSTANTWISPQTFSSTTFANGGLEDVSSTHIAPTYTYSVCQNPGECDYTTLEAALAQASSTQVPTAIYVHGGSYIVPAGGYKICSDRLMIRGDGQATVFNFNLGGANSAFAMCDATQRSFITLQDFYVHNLSSVASTTGIDFDHFALSTFERLRIASFNNSYYVSSTGSIYDKFVNNTDSPSGQYGFFLGNVANDTTIQGERMVVNNTSTICYGIYGNGTHAINLISDNCEHSAQIAIDIGNGTHDITVSNFYSEQNAIGVQIASNTYAISFIGGFFGDATTTAGQSGPEDINNLGGIYCFYNVNIEYKNFTHCEIAANTPDSHWLTPYFTSIVSSNQTSTATTTVYNEETPVPNTEFICGINFVTGSATDTGVVAAGIYGPITTLDKIDGAPLVVQATTTEQSNGSVNTGQIIALPTTRINGGNYYISMWFTSTSTQYQRNPNQTQAVGLTQTFVNNTTTQLLPTTAPTGVNSPSAMPGLRLETCSQTNTL